MKVKFFGVGAALEKNLGNTHFLIEDGDNSLQVDCGGGLKLAQLVKRGDIFFENIFITHCHTDHFLGFFNLLRNIPSILPKLNVYCSSFVEKNIRTITPLLMGKRTIKLLDNGVINFINNNEYKEEKIGDFLLKPINLNSKKMIQFGFFLEKNGLKILFFGDEAINILEREDLNEFIGIDYLICEAMIEEKDSIKGGGSVDLDEMSHISARESGKIATKFNAKNLIIIHTREIVNRKESLKNDAELEFSGNIFVPNDGDEINL